MLSKRTYGLYSCEFDARHNDVIIIIFLSVVIQSDLLLKLLIIYYSTRSFLASDFCQCSVINVNRFASR